ncbi:MAG TPA: hypothetical protein VI612_00375 [Candidatus Nanoarchaeia archaeon]|nr:hypothetical protein [Candidatus Nanoarchaeia archaeon]
MGVAKYLSLLLIFLIACTTTDTWTVPTAQRNVSPEQETNACENVSCPTGQTCDNGQCACTTGKLCDGECISNNACCTSSDCDEGICQDNECAIPGKCKIGEEFADGECRCASNTLYCAEQDRCIERGNCCVHTQCERFQRCVPTQYRASLCVKIGEKKFCRIVSDIGREETFTVLNQSFEAKSTQWFADNSIELILNNRTVTLPENSTITFNESIIYHEGVQIVGGFCKEDEDA